MFTNLSDPHTHTPLNIHYEKNTENTRRDLTSVQGTIFAEPFIHYYPSGKAGCFFRIGGNGSDFSFTKNNSEFILIHCLAYNRLGTDIFKRFNLGDNIHIEGVLEVSVDLHGKNFFEMTVTSFKRIEE